MSGDAGEIRIEFALDPATGVEIRPAPHRRDWMDATPEGYANRCLPLVIANAHGWELLNPVRTLATWTGGPGVEDIVVLSQEEGRAPVALSHFGAGVLTFQVPGHLRTPPGWDLWVQGPVNRPKAHVQGLTGVVETDWAPFGFTMNWRFTTPGATVVFEAGEPFAHLFPMPRGMIERVRPVLRRPDPEDARDRAHAEWSAGRGRFLDELAEDGSEARAKGWQKDYTRGPAEAVEPPHRTRLRPRPFSPPED